MTPQSTREAARCSVHEARDALGLGFGYPAAMVAIIREAEARALGQPSVAGDVQHIAELRRRLAGWRGPVADSTWPEECRRELDALERLARSDQLFEEYELYLADGRRRARSDACRQWHSNEPVLQKYLAVTPPAHRAVDPAQLDRLYRRAAGLPPTASPWLNAGAEGYPPPPPPPPVAEVADLQEAIALYVRSTEARQTLGHQFRIDRWSQRLDGLSGGLSFEGRGWLELGRALGRTLWSSYCPVWDRFVDCLPVELTGTPAAALEGVDLPGLLGRFVQKVQPGSLTTGSGNAVLEPGRLPDVASLWTVYLETVCRWLYDRLADYLQRAEDLLAQANPERSFRWPAEGIPPAFVIDNNMACLAGGDLTRRDRLSARQAQLVRQLQGTFPDGMTLPELQDACATSRRKPWGVQQYLRRLAASDICWRQVLTFPQARGRGGYRLRWPLGSMLMEELA